MYETLRLERTRPGIATLTLSRPDRLNALSWEMVEELGAALAELGADREIRVVVLTGEGRGFCAGIDIKQPDAVGSGDGDPIAVYHRQEAVAGLAIALRDLPQPVVAAVNGPAAGGGMALALAADIRICSTAARFNVAFVKIGLSGCDIGVSYLLPRIVGLGLASELMLTGRMVEAEEAARVGLANRVVEPDELLASADEMADQIAANSPFGVWMTKQVLGRNVDAGSLRSAIELENRTQVLTTRTDDMKEALAAFVERRPARFGEG
ncbi:MAG TPA: enoyl-CoA hydratase-related protein [Solirubrobacterales bacterium]|jgi:enoyl-CoA hydratase|nr:enoyl-CoA hydratase-related protein [Solirubrobacterales bacterium]